MTTSKTNLIGILAVVAGLLSANAAFAGGKGKGGGNSGNHVNSLHINSNQFNSNKFTSNKFTSNKVSNTQFNSNKFTSNKISSNQIKNNNLKLKFNGNQSNLSQSLKLKQKDFDCKKNDKNCHDGFCWWKYGCYSSYNCYPYYYGCYYPLYNCYTYCGQAYEPFHCTYIVLPGDSFYTISLKEYGTSVNGMYIARFNNLPMSTALVPGQTLMMPSISATKTLSVSGAPAADANSVSAVSSVTSPISTGGSFNSNITVMPAVETTRTKVPVGSVLRVDGQAFGDRAGVARLRVSGLSMPIEVVEWTSSAVKIRLPQVELAAATVADIDVVRADGSLASKTAVELTAGEQLALGQ